MGYYYLVKKDDGAADDATESISRITHGYISQKTVTVASIVTWNENKIT